MMLLWTYTDLLKNPENDAEVLSILTDILECDLYSPDTIEIQIKKANKLKDLGEEEIYEQVMQILDGRLDRQQQGRLALA